MEDYNLLSEYPISELVDLLMEKREILNPKEDEIVQEIIRRLTELDGRVKELEKIQYVQIDNVEEDDV